MLECLLPTANAAATLAQPATYWPARLPRSLVIPETTLWFNLNVTAQRFPHRTAYQFFGQALTYAELHRQAEALAGWLQAQGVKAGDRVLLFMQNCPQYVIAFYAVQRADAVVVPVNPMNRAEEFGHYIVDPQARVAITMADLAPIVAEANAQVPEALRLQQVLVARYTDAMPAVIADADAHSPAMLAWLTADPPLPPG